MGQPLKAYPFKTFTLPPIITDFKLLQSLKVLFSILVTRLGIVMEDKFEQL